MAKLLILGAGEYGKLVKELASDMYSQIDFLDDKSELAIGKFSDYRDFVNDYDNAIVAIGNSVVRMVWITKLIEAGYKVPTIISDRAYVSPSASIDIGCVIEPMTIINNDAKIERGCLISSGAVINHNAVVEEGCHIDCLSIVGAAAVVPAGTHLDYGQILKRDK